MCRAVVRLWSPQISTAVQFFSPILQGAYHEAGAKCAVEALEFLQLHGGDGGVRACDGRHYLV